MTDMGTPVFVYGTLRQGGHLHSWLHRQRFVGKAVLPNFLMHQHECGAYPVVVPMDDGFSVQLTKHTVPQGEVYLLRRDLFAELCAMELMAGYDATWELVHIDGTFSKIDAVVFTWSAPNVGPLVPTGDWFDVEPAEWPTQVVR